jgi:hypothetical protein
LVAELIEQCGRWGELAFDRGAERDAMRPVVDAARVVAGCDWMKQGYTFDRAMAALADAVDRLDDPARAPLGHAEPISAPDEYPSGGESLRNDLRPIRVNWTHGDSAALAALVERTSDKTRKLIRQLPRQSTAEEQTLREIAVKRWHKIERLRGKLYRARAKSKQRCDILASAEAALRDFQSAHREVKADYERLLTAAKQWRAALPFPDGLTPAAQHLWDAVGRATVSEANEPHSKAEPDMRTTAELHRDLGHPGWEYATGFDKPPPGNGWESNVDLDSGREQCDIYEAVYWRRLKPASEVAE